MLYEYYGYPPDFLERYRAGIEKVTVDDVARVARKYVGTRTLALLVVGKAAGFRPAPLEHSDRSRPSTSRSRAGGPEGPARCSR